MNSWSPSLPRGAVLAASQDRPCYQYSKTTDRLSRPAFSSATSAQLITEGDISGYIPIFSTPSSRSRVSSPWDEGLVFLVAATTHWKTVGPYWVSFPVALSASRRFNIWSAFRGFSTTKSPTATSSLYLGGSLPLLELPTRSE